MEINSQLKYFRQRDGFTQKQVADAIGIDKTTYAHYESGRRVPNAKIWVKLSEVLGFPVFPAQIQIVYPEGLLDKFEKCIADNGKPTGNFRKNNECYMEISSVLSEIHKINEKSMDVSDLPLDKIAQTPINIMNVAFDARAERLTRKAFKCMEELMAENEELAQVK